MPPLAEPAQVMRSCVVVGVFVGGGDGGFAVA
jgi:hypothetical protein